MRLVHSHLEAQVEPANYFSHSDFKWLVFVIAEISGDIAAAIIEMASRLRFLQAVRNNIGS